MPEPQMPLWTGCLRCSSFSSGMVRCCFGFGFPYRVVTTHDLRYRFRHNLTAVVFHGNAANGPRSPVCCAGCRSAVSLLAIAGFICGSGRWPFRHLRFVPPGPSQNQSTCPTLPSAGHFPPSALLSRLF
jgi:hypothetical protein